jgi:penicillin-binding protein 2
MEKASNRHSMAGRRNPSVAIGQGYDLATPLQMLVFTSAVANGGKMLKPLVLKSVHSPEGSVIVESKRQLSGKLPVSKKTLQIIKKGLWDVVDNPKGTAWIAHVEGLDISGKTGTAQVVGRSNERNPTGKELSDRFKSHAWFVAYAPSADPQIAVSVIVEHGGHGSSAAGPIAREIIKTYLGWSENTDSKALKVANNE